MEFIKYLITLINIIVFPIMAHASQSIPNLTKNISKTHHTLFTFYGTR